MQVSSLQYRKLDFEEFCAASISVHQLEGMESWEQHARRGYEFFEKDGNRPIMIEELASVHSPFSPFSRRDANSSTMNMMQKYLNFFMFINKT